MEDMQERLDTITAQLNELHNTGLAGFSDDALALRFTERHGDELRYVAPWSRWYQWTGTHWEPERTLLALSYARDILRQAAKAANSGGKGLASNTTVGAVVSLARSDRRHAATIEQWDVDAWLLNTPTGMVDLKSGDVRPHDREAYVTMVTATGPSATSCPLWRTFLGTVTAGDIQLEAFLQRMVGYCLTGSTRDHAMFFLYGLGANGKSVFIRTIMGILAKYCRVAPMEMLLASKLERHPTELAGLMGKRLVVAVETEQGRRWAEAKIKNLTGGDTVTARFMRGDFFDFTPSFKLLIAGNHKPSLNRVDEAMRRRFNLVPFTVTIPDHARDPHLADKLRDEWPAILQWAIDGCLEWQEHGLTPPKCVVEATEEYFASQNVLKNWISECCTTGDNNVETKASDLFKAWKEWCQENNEYAGSLKSYGQQLQDAGFLQRHGMGGNVYRGIRLKF